MKPVHAEGLSVESLLAKEDKMIIYQLAPDKPTTDIEEWFKGKNAIDSLYSLVV